MYSDIELREVFHFCFLEQFLNLSDTRIYLLKGGVNLRFFFKSPRYSEDMDIDVLGGSVETLKKNVYKVLDSSGFKRKLNTYGIDDLLINDPSKMKQTKTTQRFKLNLVNNNGDLLATKIEFSRREPEQRLTNKIERLDSEISRKYSSLSYLVNHYDGASALLQKILALAGRKEVQARDVFDIFILDQGGFSRDLVTSQLDKELIPLAQDALLSIDYKDYEAKVLEFLSEEDKLNYSGIELWREIQGRVLELLLR